LESSSPRKIENGATGETDLGAGVVIKEACDELGAVLGILVVTSVYATYLRHCNTINKPVR